MPTARPFGDSNTNMDRENQAAGMVRERDESGQYVETVGADDVLAVFDQVRGPAITSSDVAEALDCTTEAARQKLTRLYDQGQLDKRKTGRIVVWWRADEERPTIDAEAISDALDDLEAADERGDRHAAREALQRAREAVEDGGE